MFSPLLDFFNEYSQENNLNITVKLDLLTILDMQFSLPNFGSYVESLLNKKDKEIPYDIFIYDQAYIRKYSSNLLDLKDFLTKEEINRYDPYLISETCVYDDRLIGMVIT